MQIDIHDPRPCDMAELARLTAIELRKRGIWAQAGARFKDDAVLFVPRPGALMAGFYYVDDLQGGPIGCADVIQAEESRRAREWAGDK